MEKTFSKISAAFISCLLLIASSCSKKLIEEPKTVFTIEYLKTANGLQSGTVALYSGMRYIYGPNGGLNTMNSGTDEWSLGDQGASSGLDCGAYNLNSTNGDILTPWNRSFNNINLANGIIAFAPSITMDANLKAKIVAEAHFFRGLYYFGLVQQFGAVPLDLGSGDSAFNQQPFQGFNRLVPDLLKKNYQLIINDFTYASQNLPTARPANGGFYIYKAAAYHMLAKAYLFRSYNATAKQPTDFKSAWDAAKYVIDNQASLGNSLLTDYADIHKEGNDYNAEILYSVERIQGSPFDNETNDVSNEFSGKANMSCNWFNSNYQNNVSINGAFPCDRVIQYMRPLRQLAPNPWLIDSAFADKRNDSRYDNTFRTVWLATNNNAAASGVRVGDTAYFLAPSKAYGDSLKALGTKKYIILDPTQFYLVSRPAYQLYPSLKKYDDNKRATIQDASGRPFVVSKLSEVYLEAAEAAILDGRPADALPLILTLRQRAAYRPGLSTAELSARQAVMRSKNVGTATVPSYVNLTAADMTVDFVMTERSRELCGESLRWTDLACRGLLIEYVKNRARNPVAAPKIQPHHVLRPIPQSQLDASIISNPASYQNPGY
ncbi:MAG: RagB/SusD family nutrient uptake outer membrane protein [Flavobacterium sp.]|nr:RagB/SusD family nutrient uptake outer membrane protein [Flavobacterium sp.]